MTARPRYRDAYLVEDSMVENAPVGAVRRRGAVWQIFPFGLPSVEMPGDVYASREDAGKALLAWVAARSGSTQAAPVKAMKTSTFKVGKPR